MPCLSLIPSSIGHELQIPMARESLFETQEITGVLIDLDGTLIDHFDALYRSFSHAASTLGYPTPTREQVRRAIGGSMPVTIRQFIDEKDVEEGISIWRNYFDQIFLETGNLMPGAIRLLKTTQNLGIATAVFTNKIGLHARGLCDQLGASPYLKFTLGAEDTPYRKPEVEFSTYALRQLGVSARNTIMVGDSPFDIQAAHCVGMASFTVPTGSHTRQELLAAKTDKVFDGLDDIAAYLENARAKAQ